MKINLSDIVYLVQRDRSDGRIKVGDEGLVVQAREQTLNIAWASTGLVTWTQRTNVGLEKPTGKGDVKVGDLVSLKTDTYTVDGRKMSRRDHSLPPRSTNGTVKRVYDRRAVVTWNGYKEREVDLNCLTVAPTQREMEEVRKSLGVLRED